MPSNLSRTGKEVDLEPSTTERNTKRAKHSYAGAAKEAVQPVSSCPNYFHVGTGLEARNEFLWHMHRPPGLRIPACTRWAAFDAKTAEAAERRAAVSSGFFIRFGRARSHGSAPAAGHQPR